LQSESEDTAFAPASFFTLHPVSAESHAFLIALFRIGADGVFIDPRAGIGFIERCLRQHNPAQ
jgi:hypothetical protein